MQSSVPCSIYQISYFHKHQISQIFAKTFIYGHGLWKLISKKIPNILNHVYHLYIYVTCHKTQAAQISLDLSKPVTVTAANKFVAFACSLTTTSAANMEQSFTHVKATGWGAAKIMLCPCHGHHDKHSVTVTYINPKNVCPWSYITCDICTPNIYHWMVQCIMNHKDIYSTIGRR